MFTWRGGGFMSCGILIIQGFPCVMSTVGHFGNNIRNTVLYWPKLYRAGYIITTTGNPLLHIVQNTIVLEGPSDSSQQKADEVTTYSGRKSPVCTLIALSLLSAHMPTSIRVPKLSTAKLNLSSHDKLVIESLVQRQPAVSRKRRRRAKVPTHSPWRRATSLRERTRKYLSLGLSARAR